MQTYIAQRLLLNVPTVIGLTVLVFFVLHLVIPTDTVDLMIADAQAKDPEVAQQLREEFGLTGSLPRQYLAWVGGLVQGDLGASFYTKRSVVQELKYRLPTSIELGLGALLITLVIAIPIGIVSAVRQDTLADYVLRGGAVLMDVIPGFWLATLVIVFGSIWFSWAPAVTYRSWWQDPLEHVRIIYLPMLLLGLSPAGSMVRLVRTQVLEVLREDYVRTARAKGLAVYAVYSRHVLRNALLPVVTLVGLRLPGLIAGTVIFETIFGLPGVGRYLLDSIKRLDYQVIQSTNLVFGLILIMSNLIVDVSYTVLDPRIKFR